MFAHDAESRRDLVEAASETSEPDRAIGAIRLMRLVPEEIDKDLLMALSRALMHPSAEVRQVAKEQLRFTTNVATLPLLEAAKAAPAEFIGDYVAAISQRPANAESLDWLRSTAVRTDISWGDRYAAAMTHNEFVKRLERPGEELIEAPARPTNAFEREP